MQVSLSSYYAYCKRAGKPRKGQVQNQALLGQIKMVYHRSGHSYGSPRIYRELRENGVVCSENRVARLMKTYQIAAKRKRKFIHTTDSTHTLPVAENKLKQHFTATAPNQKWVADLTYIWTGQGWLYLAVVLDVFSRQVVGYAMATPMKTQLVCDALQMALQTRPPPKGLLHHSDRGSQYASHAYQQVLRDHQIICSMSRKGNCYDKAMMESFLPL